MSDKPNEQDPFKPQEPNIPGVTGNPARHKPAPEPPRPATSQYRSPTASTEKIPAQKWLAIAALAIGLVSLAVFLWKHSGAPAQSQDVPAAVPVVDLQPIAASQPAVVLAVGPGPVATTAELAKPWSSKRFEFHVPQTADNLSARRRSSPQRRLLGLLVAGAIRNMRTRVRNRPRQAGTRLRFSRGSSHGWRSLQSRGVRPHALWSRAEWSGSRSDRQRPRCAASDGD